MGEIYQITGDGDCLAGLQITAKSYVGMGANIAFGKISEVLATIESNAGIHGIVFYQDIKKLALMKVLAELPAQISVIRLENWQRVELLEPIIMACQHSSSIRCIDFSGDVSPEVKARLKASLQEQDDILACIEDIFKGIKQPFFGETPEKKLMKVLQQHKDDHEELIRQLVLYIDGKRGSYETDSFNCRLIVMLNQHYSFGLAFDKHEEIIASRDLIVDKLIELIPQQPVEQYIL